MLVALAVAASVVAAVPVAVKAFLKYLKDLEPASVGLPSLSRSQSALASEAVAVEPVEAMAELQPVEVASVFVQYAAVARLPVVAEALPTQEFCHHLNH